MRPRSRKKRQPQKSSLWGKRVALTRFWTVAKRFLIGLSILLAVVILFVGIYSFYLFNQISFPGRELAELPEWEGDTNINLMLVGLSNRDGAESVSSISILYLKPIEGRISLLAVDPDLAVRLDRPGRSQRLISYRNLFGVLNSQLELDARQRGLDLSDDQLRVATWEEFNFYLEADLGLSIDRYLTISADEADGYLRSFNFLNVDLPREVSSKDSGINFRPGLNVINTQDQLNIMAASDNGPDEKLQNQLFMLRRYIGAANQFPRNLVHLAVLPILAEGKGIDTNLSTSEMRRVLRVAGDTPRFNIESSATSRALTYIEQGLYLLDRSKYDNEIKNVYFNQQIIAEQARVDVINGSGRRGLATKTRRLLRNYSYNVVRVGNTSEIYTRNTLYVADPEPYPETIDLLRRLYPDLRVENQDYPHRPTGDMVLVVI